MDMRALCVRRVPDRRPPSGPGLAASVLASVRGVSAIGIRRRLRRQRRHLAMIIVVLAPTGLLAVHHSGALMDLHPHTGMGAVIQMCLGVFTAVGAVLAAAAVAVVALGPRRPTRARLPGGATSALDAPLARARHGPAAVCVLCVSRR
jgi:hypothetical protein